MMDVVWYDGCGVVWWMWCGMMDVVWYGGCGVV